MIKTFLQNSLSEGKESELCRGWDYLKTNAPPELKKELEKSEYWALTYNSQKTDYLIKNLNLSLSEAEKHQLDSFVYLMNCKKREEAEIKKDNELRQKMLSEGFKEENIFNVERLKELNGLKVICLMDVSKIGLLGSFDEKEKIEGKFIYVERINGLMILPKRSRTRGFIIRKNFYWKVV